MVKSLAKYTLPYWCIRWGGHQRIDFFHGLQFLHFSGNVHNSWNLVGQYLWPPSTGLALRVSNFKILKNPNPCRSTRSWLLAIVGAEYVLGLLPRGTHEVCEWHYFLWWEVFYIFLLQYFSGRSLWSQRSLGGFWMAENALWGKWWNNLIWWILRFK